MAYRFCLIGEVQYGHFGDYARAWRKLDDIMRERGWITARVLVPTAGRNNEVIAEFEYPDLATFERENSAFYADAAAFQAFQASAEFMIQGTGRTALYEDVPIDALGAG